MTHLVLGEFDSLARISVLRIVPMSTCNFTLCVLTWARKPSPRALVASSIALQFLLIGAKSRTAAGAGMSLTFLPTCCNCNAAFDGDGQNEGAEKDDISRIRFGQSNNSRRDGRGFDMADTTLW